jgi:Asp-tRNA(Asn)/Glu-tRNA(Gln) amidotransferase A subunit family amidase
MDNSAGLPVGVQVMTPMWRDELCLYVMSEIEKSVNYSSKPTFVLPQRNLS